MGTPRTGRRVSRPAAALGSLALVLGCGGRTLDDAYWGGESATNSGGAPSPELRTGGGTSMGTGGHPASWCPWQCATFQNSYVGVCSCGQDTVPFDGCDSSNESGPLTCPEPSPGLQKCCSIETTPADPQAIFCHCLYDVTCPVEPGRTSIDNCPPDIT